jgi:hypothetical protein
MLFNGSVRPNHVFAWFGEPRGANIGQIRFTFLPHHATTSVVGLEKEGARNYVLGLREADRFKIESDSRSVIDHPRATSSILGQ